MKYKCNDCGWTGYGLASGRGANLYESVCPKCGSIHIEKVEEKNNFSDPEGDMGSIDDYYANIGSGMA